jgi:hypothetical protein
VGAGLEPVERQVEHLIQTLAAVVAGGPAVVPVDGVGRATEVDVDGRRPGLMSHDGSLGHTTGVAAEELDLDRQPGRRAGVVRELRDVAEEHRLARNRVGDTDVLGDRVREGPTAPWKARMGASVTPSIGARTRAGTDGESMMPRDSPAFNARRLCSRGRPADRPGAAPAELVGRPRVRRLFRPE